MFRRGWMVLAPWAVIAFSGCGTNATVVEPSSPEIEVSLPVVDTITDYEVFTGRTQATNSVELRARVTGYLEQAPFKEGDDVKKGDVLFEIQQNPFVQTLKQAQATRDSQRVQLTLNESLFRRHQALRGQNAMSVEDFQTTVAARDKSRAAVAAAEAAVAIAQQNLDWTVIHAPFNGRMSRRNIDPGNDVIADNTVLATIVELDKLYAYFDVDERTLLRLTGFLARGKVPVDSAKKLPVMLGLANEKPEEFSHPGLLSFADNRVDTATGTLRLWGTFDNSYYALKPGMFVRVRLGVGEPRKLLFVTESALGSDQGRKFLYILNDEDKVVYTRVETGQRKDGLIAIESGLKGGERVVVNGLQRVRPQMEIIPKPIPMPRVTKPSAMPAVVGIKTP